MRLDTAQVHSNGRSHLSMGSPKYLSSIEAFDAKSDCYIYNTKMFDGKQFLPYFFP